MKKNNLKKACLSLSVVLGLIVANGSVVYAYNLEDVVLVGDINQSGTVDITDLTQLSLYLIGDTKFSEREEKIADTEMNGIVDLCDLANFRRFLSKGTDENSPIMIGKSRLLDTTQIERPPMPDDYSETVIIPGSEVEQPIPPLTEEDIDNNDKFWIERTPEPEKFLETVIIPGSEVEQPIPPLTEKDIEMNEKFQIERLPIPEVLPVNAEGNNYNYAILSGKTYSKRCVCVFDKNQIDEKSMLAFIIEDAETSSGTMAEINTLIGLCSEDIFLLKCGETEGKYYIFINEKTTEEETKLYMNKLGITEYTTPEVIPEQKFEQPIPAMES